jgi:hypothetical protein
MSVSPDEVQQTLNLEAHVAVCLCMRFASIPSPPCVCTAYLSEMFTQPCEYSKPLRSVRTALGANTIASHPSTSDGSRAQRKSPSTYSKPCHILDIVSADQATTQKREFAYDTCSLQSHTLLKSAHKLLTAHITHLSRCHPKLLLVTHNTSAQHTTRAPRLGGPNGKANRHISISEEVGLGGSRCSRATAVSPQGSKLLPQGHNHYPSSRSGVAALPVQLWSSTP